MAKKKFSKPISNKKTFFTYPELHEQVVDSVADEIPSPSYCNNINDRSFTDEYNTNIMGRFRCSNNDCSTKGWGSKRVAILIRGYAGNGYNVKVFNQRCRTCNHLGLLTVDEQSYIDRVSYRVKKWAGVPGTPPPFNEGSSPPHREDLCEGCKAGVCRRSKE